MPAFDGRFVKATLIAWLATIGFDLVIHAGVLARLYLEPRPFLLPAETMFRRIPLGYLCFLLLTGFLVWLMTRFDIRSPTRGFRFGVAVGAVLWGAFLLGLYSIATIPAGMALGWFGGQAVELGVGGAFGAASLGAEAQRGLVLKALGFVFLCVALTVVLQSTGLAPPIELR